MEFAQAFAQAQKLAHKHKRLSHVDPLAMKAYQHVGRQMSAVGSSLGHHGLIIGGFSGGPCYNESGLITHVCWDRGYLINVLAMWMVLRPAKTPSCACLSP